jgi:aspartyl-tRNA(Asn)/glutamyl-tRNA(Gln) amidotransferase subunit B
MSKYAPTIGLEIHAELKTRTKMFCSSKNDPDEREPNLNICPVCVGYPGTLPTINKEAVRHILKLGLTVGGKTANFSEFDRKNYFYPDIPKGYQISQYKFPLVQNGKLANVELERIHLEEDTARSLHEEGDYSLVDFNRAGLPLMELVTKPVIKSAKKAAFFAKELQLLLKYLDASEANMEKGEMRVEANISVSPDNSLGTKVEIKNLNSFRSVEKAIDFEVDRQIDLLEEGGEVIQETRGWNEIKEKTFSQRLKEFSHDYRYFPEPDLPKLYISEISEFEEEVLKRELPELPWQKRKRYLGIGLKEEDVEFFVRDAVTGTGLYNDLFQKVLDSSDDKETLLLAGNYIVSDIVGLAKKGATLNIRWQDFVELLQMIRESEVSSRGAKDILAVMLTEGGSPAKIAEEKDLLQKSDKGELKEIVQRVIKENSKVVDEYKNGKETALQFLIGQGMKETKGSANPGVLKELFISELK